MQKSQKVTAYGLFTALIVVLQLLSYVVRIGTFNLSLVLVPIILGAYLYGPEAGAVFGGAFGIIVDICCLTGLDLGGFTLVSVTPVATLTVCFLKGVAAGAAAGFVSKALKGKNPYLAIMLSAITAPVVNTGLFIIALCTVFRETLYQWAGGTDIVTYIFVGLVGVNFLIELAINVIAAPSLLRVTKALRKV